MTQGLHGIKVGVTVGLQSPNESLWSNGIKQNAVFLMDALKRVPGVAEVFLVNTTDVDIGGPFPWDVARWPTVSFSQAKDQVDVLIELGGQIDALQTAYLHQRGAKLVSYCCGFEYIHAMESMLFRRNMWPNGVFINQQYDGIWMIPQVANTSQHFFETLRRKTAKQVPFVWDPVFVTERSQHAPNAGEYRPRIGPRRLTVFEPNINVVKFCLYPVFIAEEAFRIAPEEIEFLHVVNAKGLAEQSKDFVYIMRHLDIVNQHKAAFIDRQTTPDFLSKSTDIVVSHQWENPLNYLYLEVCWQGYPLVHNAHLCADLGYYYPGNDVKAGRDALLRAMREHDGQWQQHLATQRRLIERYLPQNPAVTDTYAQLLNEVVQGQSN
jgi:Protein of unknown function (DUF2827)